MPVAAPSQVRAESPNAIIERLLPRPAEEVAKARYARWGFYGLNGAGKTTLLSTVPPDQNWWVVSIDKENVLPLKGHPNIRVIPMREWDDMDDILHLTKAAIKTGKLHGIAWDTYTRVQAHAANKIAGSKIIDPYDDKLIAAYMEGGPGLFKNRDMWQQWGSLTAVWMDFFTDLPLHTIFLFQEWTVQPKFENDILNTVPMLRPEPLARAFDSLHMLGRLYVSLEAGGLVPQVDAHNREINPAAVEKRMLLLGSHPRYRAKGDTAKLGYVVEEPTWEKLSIVLK